MNVKKVIGAGLLAALVGCDYMGANTFAVTHLPEGASKVYLVNNFQKPEAVPASNKGVSCNNPQHAGVQIQTPKSKQRDEEKSDQSQQSVHNHPGGQPYGQTIDKDDHIKGKDGDDSDDREGRSVKSVSGHVHTPDNKAGDNPDDAGSKHSWREKKGNPHETEESKDKKGQVHQIHRWLDNNGRSHETEHWTDERNSVHQCHRWEAENGETHEAVHVTKKDGTVVSEHFSKDREGKVKKIEEKENNSDRRREKESDSSSKGKSEAHKNLRGEEENSSKKDGNDRDDKG